MCQKSRKSRGSCTCISDQMCQSYKKQLLNIALRRPIKLKFGPGPRLTKSCKTKVVKALLNRSVLPSLAWLMDEDVIEDEVNKLYISSYHLPAL